MMKQNEIHVKGKHLIVQGDDKDPHNPAPSNQFLKLKEADIQEDIDFDENEDVVESDLHSSPDRGGGNIVDSSMGGMTQDQQTPPRPEFSQKFVSPEPLNKLAGFKQGTIDKTQE